MEYPIKVWLRIILTVVEPMPQVLRLIASVWSVISYLYDANTFAQEPILILRPTYQKNCITFWRISGTKIQYLYAILYDMFFRRGRKFPKRKDLIGL